MHATQPPPTSDTPTASETVSPANALRLAADYLTQHGWIQHNYYAPWDAETPPACALGALAIVCYGQPIADPFDDGTDDGELPGDPAHLNRWHDFVTAHQCLLIYLNRNSGVIGLPVDDWNDTPGHTRDNVITSLRAAANHTATTAPFGQVQP